MTKAIAMTLVAMLLTACAASGPSISSNNQDYWKSYGRTHGADANGG
jgi:starvation-inducible outer membrane lipoprotein